MFRAVFRFVLPLSTHTRDCCLLRYANRTEIKVPLHSEKILDKPEVIVEKDTITIVFNKVDELE